MIYIFFLYHSILAQTHDLGEMAIEQMSVVEYYLYIYFSWLLFPLRESWGRCWNLSQLHMGKDRVDPQGPI